MCVRDCHARLCKSYIDIWEAKNDVRLEGSREGGELLCTCMNTKQSERVAT